MSNEKTPVISKPFAVEVHKHMGNSDLAEREATAFEDRQTLFTARRAETAERIASQRKKAKIAGIALTGAALVTGGAVAGANLADRPVPVEVKVDAPKDLGNSIEVRITQPGEAVETYVRDQNPGLDPRPITDNILEDQTKLGAGRQVPEGHFVVPVDTRNYEG